VRSVCGAEICCSDVCKAEIAVYPRSSLQEKTDSRTASGKSPVRTLQHLSAVEVDRNFRTGNDCLHNVPIVEARPSRVADIREMSKWAIPPYNLDILRAVTCTSEIDFITRNSMGSYRGSKAEFDFFKNRIAVLVYGVNRCLHHLVRAPHSREDSGRIVISMRSRLRAKRKTWNGLHVCPVKANGTSVDPVFAFRERILGEGKASGVALLHARRGRAGRSLPR